MRKLVALALTLGLVAGALATPALAGKKKKRAKPVPTTLFMHGKETIGEAESTPNVADQYLSLDAVEPKDGEPKSHGILNGVVTPNQQCAGNTYFAVFVGPLSGQVVGDVTVTLHTLSTPAARLDVRIWPDVSSLLCTSTVSGTTQYPEPAGEITVDLPPGQGVVAAKIEGVKFNAVNSVMVQISPHTEVPGANVYRPFAARVLYDSTGAPSSVAFDCLPAKGKSCTSQ